MSSAWSRPKKNHPATGHDLLVAWKPSPSPRVTRRASRATSPTMPAMDSSARQPFQGEEELPPMRHTALELMKSLGLVG